MEKNECKYKNKCKWFDEESYVCVYANGDYYGKNRKAGCYIENEKQ